MSKKVTTARGQSLDFDLLRLKQQISSAPQELHVRKRKNFIEQRLRRRIKRASIEDVVDEKTAPQSEEMESKVEESTAESDHPIENNANQVDNEEVAAPKQVTKQRARKKITTETGEENGTESNQ